MRADRLLSILLTLQTERTVTASVLATRLEVSQRTIYRDLDALTASGVPVYATSGPGGGIRLLEEYRTDLTGLSFDEARALLMAGGPGALADLGVGGALEMALTKLRAALPEAQRREAEGSRGRVVVDAAKWTSLREDAPHLRALERAVRERRGVRLEHQGKNGWSERVIEPLGLVSKASVWYLVARTSAGLRVFRASRVRAVTALEEHFEPPEGFDLAAFWASWTRDFEARAKLPPFRVRVRVGPELEPEIGRLGEGSTHWEPDAAPDARSWRSGTLRFADLETARAYLLPFGDRAVVLEPQALRDALLDAASRVVALYKS